MLVARTLLQLGVTLALAGRFQDAERALWRTLDIETAKRGPDDVNVARALHELGVCVRPVCGRLEEATGLLVRALAIREAKLSPDNPSVGESLYELGVCFRLEGRLEEAEAFLRRAVGIKKAAVLGEGARDAAAAAAIASRIRSSSARLSRSSNSSGSGSSSSNDGGEMSVAPAMFQLAVCILEGGRRFEEAEALLRSVLDIEEERLGEAKNASQCPSRNPVVSFPQRCSFLSPSLVPSRGATSSSSSSSFCCCLYLHTPSGLVDMKYCLGPDGLRPASLKRRTPIPDRTHPISMNLNLGPATTTTTTTTIFLPCLSLSFSSSSSLLLHTNKISASRRGDVD